MGRPCTFVRLTGCNLDCPWCDTTEVWKKGDWFNIDEVQHMGRVVFTGGEPMLQQKAIEKFIKYWDACDNKSYDSLYVEVETNGTIMPSDYMMVRVNQWNCSPKLRNSKEKWK